MLVFSAADFEDFQVERPDMPPEMEAELEPVVRILAQNRWPWRLHATYDETISRALDVFEKVNRDIPFDGLHWFFDHAETITDASRSTASPSSAAASPCSTAWPTRASISSSATAPEAAERTPPIRRMLETGVPVWRRHRRDARRVATTRGSRSAWLVTGKTVGGLRLYPAAQPPRPRDGAAAVDREHDLVLQRGRQEGQHQGRPARRPGRARPTTISRFPADEIPDIAIRADDRRRQGGLWRRRLRRTWRRRCRPPCRTGRRCGASAATKSRPLTPISGRQNASRHRPAAAPAAAASMATPTRMPGAPPCRFPISGASGVRSAAPAGRCDISALSRHATSRVLPTKIAVA